MKLEIPALKSQLGLQKEINDNLEQSIVLKNQEIDNLHEINSLNESIILNKDKEIKKYKVQNKLFLIGGCTVCIPLIFCLIFK